MSEDWLNYPPGETGRPQYFGDVGLCCSNGHEWESKTYMELGGTYYETEECPVCGESGEDVR